MRHPVRRPRDVHRALQTTLPGDLHAPERRLVIGHQKILAQKEIQLARREHAVLAAVVHRVNHHEQVRRKSILFLRAVFLNLWRRTEHHTVFDRERMKMEHFGAGGSVPFASHSLRSRADENGTLPPAPISFPPPPAFPNQPKETDSCPPKALASGTS